SLVNILVNALTTLSQEASQNTKEHKSHQLSPEAIEKLKDLQFLLS
ncbi:477_t:CDS:2, partial [Dentiscutata erythropus]